MHFLFQSRRSMFTGLISLLTLSFMTSAANSFPASTPDCPQKNLPVVISDEKSSKIAETSKAGKEADTPNAPEALSSGTENEPLIENGSLAQNGEGLSPDRVITRHLQAIRDKNPHMAWRLLSESYREEFDSPADYFGHIKDTQKPLFEHISYSILHGGAQGKKYIQRVELVTRGGRQVLAIYNFLAQKKAGWKITGITLLGFDSHNI